MNYKEKFMRKAIRLALEGKQQEGGGVFGAVITKNGKEIASCYNRVQGEQDPTQHAELRCIQLACAVLGTKNLKDCELYASCEPCIMCLGATSFAGIETIYFGASVQDAHENGFSQLPMPSHEEPEKRYRHFNMHQKLRDEAVLVWN